MFWLKSGKIGWLAICITIDTEDWIVGMGYTRGLVWFAVLCLTVHFSHKIRWGSIEQAAGMEEK